MEQLGQSGNSMNTARSFLAGAGTQTAALAFGGKKLLVMLQQQQKNTMESSWTSLLQV
jgi:hypothetical protein